MPPRVDRETAFLGPMAQRAEAPSGRIWDTRTFQNDCIVFHVHEL